MLLSGSGGWDRSMSTRHVLLNALLSGAASGYDLLKRFRPSAGHWWRPKPAQMYAELSRMEADGLVTAEMVIQTKYPNKRVFSITADGRAELRRYAAVPSPPGEFRDELVIKMLSIDVADPAVLLADVARRREWSVERLRRERARVEVMLDGQDPDTFARTADDVGDYLWRLCSIGLMEETVAWCDTVARVIELRRPGRTEQRTA